MYALILVIRMIMNKKLTALLSLAIILAFMGYIIFDSTRSPKNVSPSISIDPDDPLIEDKWVIDRTYDAGDGELAAVAVADNGDVYLGGTSFVKALTGDFGDIWTIDTEEKITALAVSGDTVFAATNEAVLLFSSSGKPLGEWGPWEGGSIITSLSSDGEYLAVADAGNKRVFVIGRKGEVISMMGHSEDKFVIPSPYFDVALGDGQLYVANTGNHRVEKFSINGKKTGMFGVAGTAPEAFCGCCNPAHIEAIPQGFVTAEKGINRIKILDRDGNFVEFVSSSNDFVESQPLDLASSDGKKIYAANKADNNIYLFIRK